MEEGHDKNGQLTLVLVFFESLDSEIKLKVLHNGIIPSWHFK